MSDSLRGVVILLCPGRRLSSSACGDHKIHHQLACHIPNLLICHLTVNVSLSAEGESMQDLNLLFGDGQPRGHSIDDAAHALAMRLPEGCHSEGVAERVARGLRADVPLPVMPAAAPLAVWYGMRPAAVSAAQQALLFEAPHVCNAHVCPKFTLVVRCLYSRLRDWPDV